MRAWRLALLLLLVACTDKRQGATPAAPPPPPSLFDPLAYTTPAGPRLAFGVRDGETRNHFLRQGGVAAHLLTRSGPSPRVIAAFPASAQGIGLWFRAAPAGTRLSARGLADGDAGVAGGELTPLVRNGSELPLRGVRATLESSATQLSTELVLLGNVRTLRDYAAGVCLEDAARFPELRNEGFELDAEHGVLRVRRVQIGGVHSMELLLAGTGGTTIALRPRQGPGRPGCPLGQGQGQPVIELAGPSGITLQLIALTSDEPLTPIEARDLLTEPPAEPRELDALAFLSYREKWLAGSWRFLTYFGRDTLLSLWMLLPKLAPEVAVAALGSVLERIQLEEGVAAPEGGVVPVGDVAHEEEVGDYAAWKNRRLTPPPGDLRQPRYDYRMIDDDFLLAPLLVATLDRAAKQAGAPQASSRSSLASFLRRRRSDGRSFEQAALANLGLVLSRARPFADDPRPPAEKKAALVALRGSSSVGQWRDSEMGLAFGRYPFDVNAALVPAALDAARELYERLGRAPEAAEAKRLGAAWRNVEELFRFEQPLEVARANVASHAAALGVADVSSEVTDDGGGKAAGYGLALDAALQPLPVQHSDHGFLLAFREPPEAYLRHVAARLTRPFPAGLRSAAGLLVANPAFAGPELTVLDPRRREDPKDDVQTPLRDLFTRSHYHGTVVWSWQQALLAAGLRRQLSRAGLGEDTRRALQDAECGLWQLIDATRAGSSRELWSWAPTGDGGIEQRPFGAGAADADESNAIQLWSTVYLAIDRPSPAQNPRCPAAPRREPARAHVPRTR